LRCLRRLAVYAKQLSSGVLIIFFNYQFSGLLIWSIQIKIIVDDIPGSSNKPEKLVVEKIIKRRWTIVWHYAKRRSIAIGFYIDLQVISGYWVSQI